jgi:hypothetical protein
MDSQQAGAPAKQPLEGLGDEHQKKTGNVNYIEHVGHIIHEFLCHNI